MNTASCCAGKEIFFLYYRIKFVCQESLKYLCNHSTTMPEHSIELSICVTIVPHARAFYRAKYLCNYCTTMLQHSIELSICVTIVPHARAFYRAKLSIGVYML